MQPCAQKFNPHPERNHRMRKLFTVLFLSLASLTAFAQAPLGGTIVKQGSFTHQVLLMNSPVILCSTNCANGGVYDVIYYTHVVTAAKALGSLEIDTYHLDTLPTNMSEVNHDSFHFGDWTFSPGKYYNYHTETVCIAVGATPSISMEVVGSPAVGTNYYDILYFIRYVGQSSCN